MYELGGINQAKSDEITPELGYISGHQLRAGRLQF